MAVISEHSPSSWLLEEHFPDLLHDIDPLTYHKACVGSGAAGEAM